MIATTLLLRLGWLLQQPGIEPGSAASSMALDCSLDNNRVLWSVRRVFHAASPRALTQSSRISELASWGVGEGECALAVPTFECGIRPEREPVWREAAALRCLVRRKTRQGPGPARPRHGSQGGASGSQAGRCSLPVRGHACLLRGRHAGACACNVLCDWG